VSRRGIAAALVLVWIVALALLAKRELLRPEGERLAEAVLSLPPGASYFAVELNGTQIGYASTTIDTLMDRDPLSFTPEEQAAHAALAFERYNLLSAPVINERGTVGAWSVSRDNSVAYSFASPTDLAQLYLKSGNAVSKKITNLNADVLAGKQIAFPAHGPGFECNLLGLGKNRHHAQVLLQERRTEELLPPGAVIERQRNKDKNDCGKHQPGQRHGTGGSE